MDAYIFSATLGETSSDLVQHANIMPLPVLGMPLTTMPHPQPHAQLPPHIEQILIENLHGLLRHSHLPAASASALPACQRPWPACPP